MDLGSVHLEFPASPGFLLSSPRPLAGLEEGGEYDPADPPVSELVDGQALIVFQTGSPELDYQLHFHTGASDRAAREKIRFGIEIGGGAILVRDGYDLMDWRSDSPLRVSLEDGYYAVDALWTPEEQADDNGRMVIHFYLNRAAERVEGNGMVELIWGFE